MSDEIGLLHAWIDAHRDEMVESLRASLRIPSKQEASAGPGAPYGIPLRKALDNMLETCKSNGFAVRDVDGYAGHAEFGEGEEMVAAMGHLDVVPEGDRWKHDPYGAEIEDGYIYARGSADDKGPLFAALFAAKAVMESRLPLKRRIRIIFGCNEESGFGCVNYYWNVAGEERPTLAFTPDACFPLVYAEKGITNLTIERRLTGGSSDLRIAAISGGLRANMVPDSAQARIVGKPKALYLALVKLLSYWDKNVSIDSDAEGISLRAAGKSAHGSTPEAGDNAVARLARALMELDLPDDKEWLEWLNASSDPAGTTLSIAGEDHIAGPLSSNLGVFKMEENLLQAVYNIRYPVTWKIDGILERAKPAIEKAGWSVASVTDSPPLHVPLDTEPSKTLMRVYREETGDTSTKPITMGGGTYARATSNAVAYGPGFPGGADGPAHEPNERFAIDTLIRSAKIYAHALYELAK